MDDLLNCFDTVAVTHHPNNPNAEHPRFAQYKSKHSGSSQAERRRKILDGRKDARYDLLMHLRQVEEYGYQDGEEEYDMDVDTACYARPRRYKNFVMLSEWLVDVPEDFASMYLSLPCPVGKRCIIVTFKGRTKCYGRNGGLLFEDFSSALPGGHYSGAKGSHILLDCIWSERNNTFYIIDLAVWGRNAMADCDTIFRFEFLKSRISELDEDASQISDINTSRFVVVPYADCSKESLTKLLVNDLPFEVPLDGVLFYHSESHYTHGPTPLVGWLKSYMFEEILGIPLPEKYAKEKPSQYVNLPQHIQYGKDMRESHIYKNKKAKDKMDDTPIPAEGNTPVPTDEK